MKKDTDIYEADIEDFKDDPHNANQGTERGQFMIDSSVTKTGLHRGVFVDKNGILIGGNKTRQAAVDAGFKKAIVVETDGDTLVVTKRRDFDLTDNDPENPARLAAYYDNRSGQLNLDFDPAVLLADVNAGMPLDEFWFEDELKDLFADLVPDGAGGEGGDAEPQTSRADELREKWGVETGQMWRLGDHLLLCGDCTNPDDVVRLMGGKKADMMFTDPPYGVDYTGGHFHSGDVNIKREREKLAGDNANMYGRFLPVVISHIDGPCYVWFAASVGKPVYDAILSNGCQIHAMLIWHKTNATYAAMNAQYKQRHEPCMYFKPKKSTLRWIGPTNERTVWEMPRDATNDLHPTQKPIHLAERAIGNHDVELVVDFFGGSGSTLIACENKGKQARVMEISPSYCAIILQRYADAFNITPELITG